MLLKRYWIYLKLSSTQNKEKFSGTITLPGNVKLVAGVNISLTEVGKFSGKWHIASSSHTIDNSGYVTEATIHKIE